AQSVPGSDSSVRVLSDHDARLYRDILRDARDGQFADAKRDTADLGDDSLKGYVLAAQYLSPRARHVHVAELIGWLQTYAELPVAERVYRLAVQKSTKKV